MANQESSIKPKKIRSKKRYEEEGLVRVEVDLDYKTYLYLLKLAEKSRYELDSDVNKRNHKETTRGKTGVITQAIVELYSKYIGDESEEITLELDKNLQQAYIFTNRINAMKKLGISEDEISSAINKKTPNYIELTKALEVKVDRKKTFIKQFPDFKKPTISDSIKKDLEKNKLTEFISSKGKST